MFEWPQCVGDPKFIKVIEESKVLVVGAGGIGCELLKTLALSGFKNLTVVDMDTIDVSNLNRQFLFRREHVGQSKAVVAGTAAQQMANGMHINSVVCNIKDSQYDVDWFKSFDIVLNGLDNRSARVHVSRMCLAANVPMVDAGTTGYAGQVDSYIPGKTGCYECKGSSNDTGPKQYPVCTLRNTPDRPVHCIVWAKDMLFTRLYGPAENTSDLDEAPEKIAQAEQGAEAADNSGQAAEQQATTSEGKGVKRKGGGGGGVNHKRSRREGVDDMQGVEANGGGGGVGSSSQGKSGGQQQGKKQQQQQSYFVKKGEESVFSYACRIYNRLFVDDINRVVSIKELWLKRDPPTPLPLTSVLTPDDVALLNNPPKTASPPSQQLPNFSTWMDTWTPRQNALVFVRGIQIVLHLMPDVVGKYTFDKDDDLAVEFVTAAANLRAINYGIDLTSAFNVKGIAGNIIHAIGTTNAITSGLLVLEAFKILSNNPSKIGVTSIHPPVGSSSRLNMLTFGEASKPRDTCIACGTPIMICSLDTSAWLWGDFLKVIVRGRLAVVAPTIVGGDIYYEEGDDVEDDIRATCNAMLPLPLNKLPGGGVVNGTTLTIDDDQQNIQINMYFKHVDSATLVGPDAECGYMLSGDSHPTPATGNDKADVAGEQAANHAQAGSSGVGASSGGDQQGGAGGAQELEQQQQQKVTQVAGSVDLT